MKISVLVAARKDSKYLAKFLFAFDKHTSSYDNVELLVMLNERDTWNAELVEYFERCSSNIFFYYENYNQGRAGLHNYYNELAKYSTGDWLVYFCEDHLIMMDDWDGYIFGMIYEWKCNPKDVWCLIPRLENEGLLNKVNHIISRGFYETIDAVGKSAWIDSYLNDVIDRIKSDRVKILEKPIIYDFSADNPGPMAEAAAQSVFVPEFNEKSPGYLAYHDPETRKLVEADAKLLNEAIEGGL